MFFSSISGIFFSRIRVTTRPFCDLFKKFIGLLNFAVRANCLSPKGHSHYLVCLAFTISIIRYF